MAIPKRHNQYIVLEDTVAIQLYRRNGDVIEATIDIEDYDYIKSLNYSWYAWWNKDTESFYCRTQVVKSIENEKKKYTTVYLHKLIADKARTAVVDHINHDTLNNRRNNLRKTEQDNNSKHRNGKNKNNKSGHRNVCWIDGKWVVQLQVKGKNTRLGSFDDVFEAGNFASEMRSKHYGKFSGVS